MGTGRRGPGNLGAAATVRALARVVAALWALSLVRASVAHAETRVVRLQSRVLGDSRTLHVSLPPNYRLAKQRYPVVYLLDGQVRAFFELTTAATSYDLTGDIRDFAMPPQIVVAIEHKDRRDDLARRSADFTRFMVEELIPYVEREFRANPYRTLIGHSLGGRFALETLCRAPSVFPAIIAISPALPDSTMAEVQGCMRRDSAPARWRTLVVPGTGLGHTDTPFATIPPALRFVFDKRVWELPAVEADSMVKQLGDPIARLERHLDVISARVGFRVAPSLKWMEVMARTALDRVDNEASLALAQRIIALYPESLSGYTLLADSYVLRRDMDSARRAIRDALALLERVESYDESGRELQRASLRGSLAGLPP